MERIKSALLSMALGLYNAAAFAMLNALMWKNGIWSERKWTKPTY